jgi:hypothetical protein
MAGCMAATSTAAHGTTTDEGRAVVLYHLLATYRDSLILDTDQRDARRDDSTALVRNDATPIDPIFGYRVANGVIRRERCCHPRPSSTVRHSSY